METGERSGIWTALVQVGAAGAVGAVMVATGVGFGLAALFMGPVAVYGFALGFLVLFVAALAAVASVTPEASWLTGSRGGRVCWGLLVCGAGIGLWWLGWRVSDEAGLGLSRSGVTWVPATIVLFASVAGTLLRRWYLALGSLAVLVAVGLLLLKELAGYLPSDLDQRLAAAHVERDKVMVANLPGYHVMPNQTSWQLVADDNAENPPSPYVSLYAVADEPDCQRQPHDTRYPLTETCEVDRPGLFYLPGGVQHAYVHRVDGRRFVLKGPLSLDRKVLREAVLTVRPTSPPEGAFTATVTGYSKENAGPDETVFSPDDKSGLPKYIEVGVQLAEGRCGQFALACEVESPTLRYERYEDQHVYLRTAGDREIRALGGLSVGRDVLRAAVQNARPATDDDLRLMLPPTPSKQDRSVMAAARGLARALYGNR